MEIAIEHLSLRFSGNISPGRARAVARLAGEAVQPALAPHAALLAGATDSYRLPSLAVVSLHVTADATDGEIAGLAAAAVARALLRRLEMA